MSSAIRTRLRARFDELLAASAEAAQQQSAAVRFAVLSLAVVFAVGVGRVAWFATTVIHGLPDAAAVGRVGEMTNETTVFDRAGRFASAVFQEQRVEVPLSQISPNFVNAVLAIEDQRFYDHHGFDLVRMVSA